MDIGKKTESLFLDDLTRFYSKIVPELISEQNKEKISFLEGALLIANGRDLYPGYEWSILEKELINNFFPKTIEICFPMSWISGSLQYLIGLQLLYGKKAEEIPAYKKIEQKINSLLDIKISYLEKYIEEEKVESHHFDILYGAASYLNYLLEFNINNPIRSKIVAYFSKLLAVNKEGLFNNLIIEIPELPGDKFINNGVAHGVMGIYYVLDKAREKNIGADLDELLLYLENYIINGFLLDEKIYIFPDLEYVNKDNKNYNFINLSWCYGLSGYSYLLTKKDNCKNSLFFNKKRKIVENINRILERELLDFNNIIFESSTFCHGISGLIYELFLLNDHSMHIYLIELINVLDKSKKKDDVVFYDIELKDKEVINKEFRFLDGSIGTWLVIQSIILNKRFKGDFLLAK